MNASLLTAAATAVVLGSAFAAGVCLLVALLPRWGAPSLSRRIAPYLRDVAEGDDGALPLGSPWATARAALARLGGVLGGSPTVRRRLAQAGWTQDVGAFRGRQLAWCLVGVVVGALAVVAVTLTGRFGPAAVTLPAVIGATGYLLCDAHLAAAARARTARIADELPTVLEFLSLCLAAGEGILDSVRRVGAVGAGELSAELRSAAVAVGLGAPLSEQLSAAAHRVQLPALSRAVDQLVAAIERGAPLASVLQAQAADAREESRRVLIEQAGRKEIYMLLPLVFLILPLSVLFAVFPGILLLRLGLG